MKPIFKVGIVGGGTMGAELAFLVAHKGIPPVIKELNHELAQAALQRVKDKAERWRSRGKFSDSDAERCISLVQVTDIWADFVEADVMIEAVPEKLDLKQRIFREADQYMKEGAILTSNTSALSIQKMAEATCRAELVAGLHFFNPPTRMPLVELIATPKTSSETLDTLEDFAKNTLQKEVVRVKECAGFLVNRLLMPYLNEAALLLTETLLTPESIDDEARRFGWPMGPFMLLDMLGIDVAYDVAHVLHKAYCERAKPAPLMQVLYDLKRFGQKSGAGFYIYGSDSAEPISEVIGRSFPRASRSMLLPQVGFDRMMLGMVSEAFLCLEEGVASAEDIDRACVFGIGFPLAHQGPLHWAQSRGLNAVLSVLNDFARNFGSRFTPGRLLGQYVQQGRLLFSEW